MRWRERGRERKGGREGGRGRGREREGGREKGVFTDDLCSMMRSVLPGQPLLLACFSSHHMYCTIPTCLVNKSQSQLLLITYVHRCTVMLVSKKGSHSNKTPHESGHSQVRTLQQIGTPYKSGHGHQDTGHQKTSGHPEVLSIITILLTCFLKDKTLCLGLPMRNVRAQFPLTRDSYARSTFPSRA